MYDCGCRTRSLAPANALRSRRPDQASCCQNGGELSARCHNFNTFPKPGPRAMPSNCRRQCARCLAGSWDRELRCAQGIAGSLPAIGHGRRARPFHNTADAVRRVWEMLFMQPLTGLRIGPTKGRLPLWESDCLLLSQEHTCGLPCCDYLGHVSYRHHFPF